MPNVKPSQQMPKPKDVDPRRAAANPAFERKVALSRVALLFERLWPRLWALIALVALFLLVSLAGAWTASGEIGHALLLAAFVAAGLAGLVWAARTPAATREDAIRRIEQRSGVPHRPGSTYEDTITAAADNPSTGALWQAHKARIAAMLAKLRVGPPSPRADRYDPLALRVLLMLGVALGVLVVGDSARDRIMAAFRLGAPALSADARLDAWITPPIYTGRQPLILIDGSRTAAIAAQDKQASSPLEVPAGSTLVVRAIGSKGLVLEHTVDGQPAKRIEAKAPEAATPAAGAALALPPQDIAEIKLELKQSGKIRVVGLSGHEAWVIKIIPDLVPKITLTKDPEQMPRGAMKLTYKIEDDYGVIAAEGRITRVRPKAGDPALSWARRAANKGARPPLERPPVLALRLPRANGKVAEGSSYHELAGHPWAGMRVRLVLTAKDQANNVGRSEPYDFVLPQRRFQNPIARAIVEQRRLLIEDPRNRPHVLKGIEAISIEPDGFFTDRRAWLGLRSAYHRLQQDRTRAGLKSTIDQLWHVAVRLEDGNLSDAERALREAQERLSQALKDGASDEEIRQLMNELRQALNQFLEQMARQSEGQQPPQLGDNGQTIRQQDLERMMRDIENMARQGSRESAQEMLSQLRDLLEQLQNGRMAQGQQGQGQQGNQMMQMMDQFGDIIGKQQQLLDDTYREQQGGQPGQPGQQGQQGQQPGQQPGQRGQGQQRGQQPGQGQQGQGPGQQGQQGQGPGQRGQGQQPGQGQQQGQGQGRGELGERQGSLRDRLGQLREGMRRNGMQAPGQLDGAEQSMRDAEQALRNGDLDGAARAEQQALDQLRQGAQQMVQEMLRRMPGQYGRAGEAPRDPLGRPPRTDGPDLGTSVKVPDEIDVQRAREILEELRRRMGEPNRPLLELDYIERLLRRF